MTTPAMRKTKRQLFTALVVPTFVVAHLFCVCLPRVASASTAPVFARAHHTGGSEHDCCPKDDKPKGDHAPECAHCGGSQLGVVSAPNLPSAPAGLSVVWLPPSVALPVIEPAAAFAMAAYRGNPPLAPPLERKCVLLI